MTEHDLASYIETVGKAGSVLGLERMRALLEALSKQQGFSGGVENAVPAIHIAGTNGKGSVGAFLATIFSESGKKVGHFSSPAVFSYEEMFAINGKAIPRKTLAEIYTAVEMACQCVVAQGMEHPTLFEVETAATFFYFAREGCDIAVIETGMGGETDATNVMRSPLACVFTPIGIDHSRFLGETLHEIATVKAGILTEGTGVAVTGRQAREVLCLLQEWADAKGVALHVVQEDDIIPGTFSIEENGQIRQRFSYGAFSGLELTLPGLFQLENAATAIETILHLPKEFQPENLMETLRKALLNTSWPGRLMWAGKLPRGAILYLDGAHNPQAMERLLESLRYYFTNHRILFIMGVLADKDYETELSMVAQLAEKLYTVTPKNSRGLAAERLAESAKNYMSRVVACASTDEALRLADREAGAGDVVIACGSFSYLRQIKD